MEILRQCGLEQKIRESALPLERGRNAIWAITLAGAELARRTVETSVPEAVTEWSPTCGVTSSQEVLEPILFREAERLQLAQLEFNTQLVSFEMGEDCVRATIVDCPSGREALVRAQYLIGADGAHSHVRQTLGIPTKQLVPPTHSVNILFRADLTPWVAERSVNLCFIRNPQTPGGLFALDGVEHWYFQAFYSPDAGQRAEDYTLRTALGRY